MIVERTALDPKPPSPEAVGGVLAFQSCRVVERLLEAQRVPSREWGERLFAELMHYFWLCEVDASRSWQLRSLNIDEAWHQFILLGAEYEAFCRRFFGRFLHHPPSRTGERAWGSPREFARAYERLYGRPLPDIWQDELWVRDDTRLIRSVPLSLVLAGDRVEVCGPEACLLRTDRRVEPALRFISQHLVFYVRELPGLAPGQRLAVSQSLMRARALHLAR